MLFPVHSSFNGFHQTQKFDLNQFPTPVACMKHDRNQFFGITVRERKIVDMALCYKLRKNPVNVSKMILIF